jgi:hypothetical protein
MIQRLILREIGALFQSLERSLVRSLERERGRPGERRSSGAHPFSIHIRVEGLKEFSSKLNDLEKKQLPFAIARGLTQTAQAIKVDEIKEMKKVFDRPTPFILNSLYITPATKTNLQAVVGVKGQDSPTKHYNPKLASQILSPHIFGGERALKGFEYHLRRAHILPGDKYVVPGECAPLNRYGNISGGLITQILSAVKAHPDPYAWRTARSIKRRKGRVTKYAVIPEGKAIPPGIYKTQGRKILPVLIFARRPLYQKRFYFYEIGQMTFNRRHKEIFNKSITDAIRRARLSG